MAAFKKAIEDCRDLSFPRVLTNLFKILSCWSLYRFRKYLQSSIAFLKAAISQRVVPTLWSHVRTILYFSTLSILTILLDKCQTKSFEDMNILIKAILKFCTTNQLFKYFRKRYSDQQLKILNKLVKTRGKLKSLQRRSLQPF